MEYDCQMQLTGLLEVSDHAVLSSDRAQTPDPTTWLPAHGACHGSSRCGVLALCLQRRRGKLPLLLGDSDYLKYREKVVSVSNGFSASIEILLCFLFLLSY